MSIKVGKISGIEIRLHYSWFVVFGLITWSLAVGYLPDQYPGQTSSFYWTVGAIASATLFLSVLVHEISHSTVARRNNVNVRGITLHFFGGVSEISEEIGSSGVELRMAAMGPLTSVAIGVVFWILGTLTPASVALGIRATLQYTSYINLALAAFNSIPAFPMDGGRVLRAFLWARSNNLLSATRRATQLSHFFSYLFMIFGLFSFIALSTFSGIWLLIIGLFIKGSADANLNETMMVEALRGVKISDIMTREVHTVDPGLTVQQLVNNHFDKFKHTGFPVVSGEHLIGVVTDHDVRLVPQENWDEKTVKDIMKPADELITLKPDDIASDALLKMANGDVGRLPVLEGDKLVGIVTRSDIARTIKSRLQFRS